jgi:predicted DsbA family dithiol-disulfide isomerase
VEWRGVEIHPETPLQGRLLTELFRAEDINRMMKHLRLAGAQFGIAFADRPFLSNSRAAHEAAEYAREHGRFEEFHAALFSTYFSQGLDIGNLDILRTIAAEVQLDPDEMVEAIRSGQFDRTVRKAQQASVQRQVTGVPTFIINDKHVIVGAQPLDTFRKILQKL